MPYSINCLARDASKCKVHAHSFSDALKRRIEKHWAKLAQLDAHRNETLLVTLEDYTAMWKSYAHTVHIIENAEKAYLATEYGYAELDQQLRQDPFLLTPDLAIKMANAEQKMDSLERWNAMAGI